MARTRLTALPPEIEKQAATGLYGFPKGVQNDCETASRKLAKTALTVAKRIYASDPKVVAFLQAHEKREQSRSATVLLTAMKEIGPKLASHSMEKTSAAEYSLYGFKAKTADLGLNACTEIRSASGRIAAAMHLRKTEKYGAVTGFLKEHAEQGKCAYSSMILSCYPEEGMKLASGEGFLEWED